MISKLTLIIGDQTLSSWSMRPWLTLKASGLKFKQIKILLDRPNTKKNILKYSPSGKVPALKHDNTLIWDSLAICEYIAELVPEKNLWPLNPKIRAVARSYVSEMHSGFPNLRSSLSMNLSLKMKINHLSPSTLSEIDRILTLWESALKKHGGPYLFGDYSIADAFYTPVVFRFLSYGIEIKSPLIKKYMSKIKAHPHVKEWVQQARKERPLFPKF